MSDDIKIQKFITEWKIYPNGQVYFSKTYPLGKPEAYKKKDRAPKKEVKKLPTGFENIEVVER